MIVSIQIFLFLPPPFLTLHIKIIHNPSVFLLHWFNVEATAGVIWQL